MTDVKLQNGDLALDSAGRPEMLGDRGARFQRAEIAMTVGRGSFIYNRSLGADYGSLTGAADPEKRAGQIFNEALADYSGTSAVILAVTDRAEAEITVNGETESREVRRYENI